MNDGPAQRATPTTIITKPSTTAVSLPEQLDQPVEQAERQHDDPTR